MHLRTAATTTALALVLSACGSQAGSGVAADGTRVVTTPSPTSSPAAPWVRVADPSGITFLFPSATVPAVSTTEGTTTRTYIAKAGGNAVASVVIIPTPVALNVKNFFVQYPIKLKAQGNIGIAADAVKAFAIQGFQGFQTAVRYVTPSSSGGSGPSYVFEQREAIQLSKYFVVISAVASNSHALSAADIAQAKAVNAHLLRTFDVVTK